MPKQTGQQSESAQLGIVGSSQRDGTQPDQRHHVREIHVATSRGDDAAERARQSAGKRVNNSTTSVLPGSASHGHIPNTMPMELNDAPISTRVERGVEFSSVRM